MYVNVHVNAQPAPSTRRARRAVSGHGQLDVNDLERVIDLEMIADTLDQGSAVVFDPATRGADQVELIVGMGQLPATTSLASEAGLTD